MTKALKKRGFHRTIIRHRFYFVFRLLPGLFYGGSCSVILFGTEVIRYAVQWGVISLCVASELENPNVNFVIMAGCRIASAEKFEMYPDFRKLKGRILSASATSDSVANDCEEAFSLASEALSGTEVKLTSDAGHKLYFTPQAIWLDPIINWINSEKTS